MTIHVLIVEDNLEYLRFEKKLLEQIPNSTFHPWVAETVGQALTTIQYEHIDVVLLDMHLPDAQRFDGLAAIRKIAPDLPIIMITSGDQNFSGTEAVKMGAQDYLLKSDVNVHCLERSIFYAIERAKIKKEMTAAREEALKASQAKSEFLASMSHDIRTPLNCIIGMADLLMRSKLGEEDSNYVQMINKASDSLLSLVNNVLDLAKIESGHFEIDRRPFDFLEMIENALEIISPRAHSKGLDVMLEIQPEIPKRLLGDSDRLKQIMINFLGNAVKFTDRGEIRLSVTQQPISKTQTSLTIAIQDTGIGISNEDLSRIFLPFSQLNGLSKQREGSGLGLAICQRLAELMNGTIHVTSEVNKGSRFEVRLTMDIADAFDSKTSLPLLDLKDKRVLIVDDNAAQCFMLKEIFDYWGASVECADTSEKAYSLTKESEEKSQKFDFIFADLRMPGIATGGMELAQKLASVRADYLGAFILMLPANHRHGDLERMKNLGVTNYLIKPPRPSTLAPLVTKMLSPNMSSDIQMKTIQDESTELRPLNVLVVDDCEENRILINAYFKGTPLTIDMAEDGQVAFEIFKQKKFDLVLMDIQMPVMDGYTAVRTFREWEEGQGLKKTPVVALTAFAMREEVEKCLASGFNSHVTKPVRKKQLLDVVMKNVS